MVQSTELRFHTFLPNGTNGKFSTIHFKVLDELTENPILERDGLFGVECV
jgi:hypothetical protein